MAKCEEGYLCDVCGGDVEEITDSDLYLRYVIGEIDPETLHTTRERHIRCNPVLAQFIVDNDFAPVVVEGPFDKRRTRRGLRPRASIAGHARLSPAEGSGRTGVADHRLSTAGNSGRAGTQGGMTRFGEPSIADHEIGAEFLIKVHRCIENRNCGLPFDSPGVTLAPHTCWPKNSVANAAALGP